MAGGSVVATVDGRGSAGDQLNLRVAYLAEFMIEIADLVIFQIELNVEIKKVDDLLRYQAHGAMNVNAAVQWKWIRIVGGDGIGR